MKNFNNMLEFTQDFGTTEQCYQHLCKVKWGNGFSCRKCNHTVAVKGRTWYYRKCQKCHYDESCTAHTLFHKLKFDVVKAFWIVYQLSTLKKGMSTMEIARQYSIHQETAWFFKRKVQQATMAKDTEQLKDLVQVDETLIGGEEKNTPGRSHGKKHKVAVGIELDENEQGKMIVKNAAAVVITGYSAEELGEAINQIADKDANISTDCWSAYPKAVGDRMHFTLPSKNGKNFIQLHWHIFNIKNWIKGIHHKISADHLQHYLNEFNYRFNRRNQIPSCPRRLMNRMIKHPWLPYNLAIAK